MKTREVEIGSVYTAKVSGKVTNVRILRVNPFGVGWVGVNLLTGREVHIRSARRLRRRIARGPTAMREEAGQ